eukprot:s293_g14.t1
MIGRHCIAWHGARHKFENKQDNKEEQVLRLRVDIVDFDLQQFLSSPLDPQSLPSAADLSGGALSFAPLATDWFSMKSSAMSVVSMAVTLTAILMGTLQGCGSDLDDTVSGSGCSASVVNGCVSNFDNAKALAGDCSEITTFLTCFAPCCDYDLALNPPTATTIDGVEVQASLGSTAIEYWVGQATQHTCETTVSCSTATVTTTMTATMTDTMTATSTVV